MNGHPRKQNRPVNALEYAAEGLYVFPIVSNGKIPYFSSWQERSTINPQTIQTWARQYPSCNWAMDCGKSGLCVLDIDTKPDKDGLRTLQSQNLTPTPSYRIQTPSGGYHYYYSGSTPSANGKLGPGIDIKSTGGYVLIPGSTINGAGYSIIDNPPDFAPTPQWISSRLVEIDQTKKPDRHLPLTELDQELNVQRAIKYLRNEAMEAIQGQNGDTTTYQTACRLRDFGISEPKAFELLSEHWNTQKAYPPWDAPGLRKKIRAAYSYAKDRPGNSAPTIQAALMFPDDDSDFHNASAINPASIPPRPWLLGKRYLQGYITLTVAPGGIGKSLLTILEALSIKTGRALSGDNVYEQGNVWIYNAEDSRDELERRIAAAAIQYQVPSSELNGLYYSSGYDQPLTLVHFDNKRLSINKDLVANLIDRINKHNILLWIVDPLICLHDAPENDNTTMNLLMRVLRKVAAKTGCAISVIHHTSKGKDDRGNIDKSRGASALPDAARIAHTLYPMSPKECGQYGISGSDWTRYIKLDNAKMNLAAYDARERWYIKHSVRINLDPETTGVLEIADLAKKVETDSQVTALLRQAVMDQVGVGESKTAYALAQELINRGLGGDKSQRTLIREITELFEIPVCVNSLTWHVVYSQRRNDRNTGTVSIACDTEIPLS